MNINDLDYGQRLAEIVPSERQLAWQRMEYYNFVHFGINTFTGAEWGSGNEPLALFNPTSFDAGQWVRAFKDSGSAGVIVTAKHHDGFCLYDTKYTDYCVTNTPFKRDIVAELSAACQKEGLQFGVYLSPWDRHEESYGTDAYNDFYKGQIRELLTGYGKLFCVWLDGACGERNGKKQVYDYEGYFKLIRELQPQAVISICGPDVRWVGNESGAARRAEFSVCDRRMTVKGVDNPAVPKETDSDIGSRVRLAEAEEFAWYPAETDVPITRGRWFHTKLAELFLTRSAQNLFKLYVRSVGHNSALLLNVPPDKRGLIPARFVRTLKKFGNLVKASFTYPISGVTAPVKSGAEGYIYEIRTEYATASKAIISEDIRLGQRVERWELQYSTIDGVYNTLAKGDTIGNKEIVLFKAVNCSRYRLIVKECRANPQILSIKLFR